MHAYRAQLNTCDIPEFDTNASLRLDRCQMYTSETQAGQRHPAPTVCAPRSISTGTRTRDSLYALRL